VLQVQNETPFVPALFVFPDAAGIDTLYVVVKATFALNSGKPRVAETQCPVVPGDEHWGEPGKSSVKYAGEAHLLKPATDVVLVGSGYALGGKPAPYFGISMAVGRLKKVMYVFGDRVWERSGLMGAGPSAPKPMAAVPLVWERAYGGRHDLGEGKFTSEPHNPVGCGFLGKRSARDLIGAPVPNLEQPSKPLKAPSDRAPLAGVGFVAPSWQPRVAFAGTYDEAWQKSRAPYLPKDFDPRFFQAAPPDQVYGGFLKGGEPVELLNLSPAGPQRFALPTCALEAEAHVGGAVERPPLNIETLLLEPDQGRFSLLWRGAVPCDKRMLKVEKVVFRLKSMAGVAA
jgi:hypothetical protein